jgi:hypothetical protein
VGAKKNTVAETERLILNLVEESILRFTHTFLLAIFVFH